MLGGARRLQSSVSSGALDNEASRQPVGGGVASGGAAWAGPLDSSAASRLGGATEDEEATYEFVVGGDGVTDGGERVGGSGGRWSSWASRLAAAGGGEGLGGLL